MTAPESDLRTCGLTAWRAIATVASVVLVTIAAYPFVWTIAAYSAR